jgi:hypothetical protein
MVYFLPGLVELLIKEMGLVFRPRDYLVGVVEPWVTFGLREA